MTDNPKPTAQEITEAEKRGKCNHLFPNKMAGECLLCAIKVLSTAYHSSEALAVSQAEVIARKDAEIAYLRKRLDQSKAERAVIEAARYIGTEHSGMCATVACNCVGHAKRRAELAKALEDLDAAIAALEAAGDMAL